MFFLKHLYIIIVNNMQCTLISGTVLVTDRPIVIFPIGYMYHIERFHIERCLNRPIRRSIRDQGVYTYKDRYMDR